MLRTLQSAVARTDDDRQRFTEERRRVEGPDEDDDARDHGDRDGPGEDAVREEQRRSTDEPDEAG